MANDVPMLRSRAEHRDGSSRAPRSSASRATSRPPTRKRASPTRSTLRPELARAVCFGMLATLRRPTAKGVGLRPVMSMSMQTNSARSLGRHGQAYSGVLLAIGRHLELARAASRLVALSLLAGCMVGPNFTKPKVSINENWSAKGNARVSTQAAANNLWWKAFNDSVLDHLVDLAYQQNLRCRSRACASWRRAHSWASRPACLASVAGGVRERDRGRAHHTSA